MIAKFSISPDLRLCADALAGDRLAMELTVAELTVRRAPRLRLAYDVEEREDLQRSVHADGRVDVAGRSDDAGGPLLVERDAGDGELTVGEGELGRREVEEDDVALRREVIHPGMAATPSVAGGSKRC